MQEPVPQGTLGVLLPRVPVGLHPCRALEHDAAVHREEGQVHLPDVRPELPHGEARPFRGSSRGKGPDMGKDRKGTGGVKRRDKGLVDGGPQAPDLRVDKKGRAQPARRDKPAGAVLAVPQIRNQEVDEPEKNIEIHLTPSSSGSGPGRWHLQVFDRLSGTLVIDAPISHEELGTSLMGRPLKLKAAVFVKHVGKVRQNMTAVIEYDSYGLLDRHKVPEKFTCTPYYFGPIERALMYACREYTRDGWIPDLGDFFNHRRCVGHSVAHRIGFTRYVDSPSR